MIRHGWAVASLRPAPGAKSKGVTVADQYDTAGNPGNTAEKEEVSE